MGWRVGGERRQAVSQQLSADLPYAGRARNQSDAYLDLAAYDDVLQRVLASQ